MEKKAKQVAALLKLLANEKRLLILCSLLEAPMSVGELVEKLGDISQSGVSQHLAQLKAHSLLDSKKQGQMITYFILDRRIEAVIKVLKEEFCKERE